jgi:hypothetical protein
MKKILLAAIAAAGLMATVASAQAAVKYGAIAYDLNRGAWGYGYNYDSDWQARNRALSECGWGGCKVYVSFNNSCGAVATDNSRGILGWGTSYTRSTAIERALYECRLRGGNCSLKVWSCTSR